MRIRPARAQDCDALTALAIGAKAHWGYPVEWLEAWVRDLTFTPNLLLSTVTLVADFAGLPVGVVCLDEAEAPPELAHLWVDPAFMGRGVGTALFQEISRRARQGGHRSLVLDSDPNALGFYLRMGCTAVGMTPAPVAGTARELPRMEFQLN